MLAGEKLDRSDDAGHPPPSSGEGSHAAIPKAGKPKRGGEDGLGDEGGPLPQPQ